jgi:hypothetical protein
MYKSQLVKLYLHIERLDLRENQYKQQMNLQEYRKIEYCCHILAKKLLLALF